MNVMPIAYYFVTNGKHCPIANIALIHWIGKELGFFLGDQF